MSNLDFRPVVRTVAAALRRCLLALAPVAALLPAAALPPALLLAPIGAHAQGSDELVQQAREAARRKDRARLVALREAAQATRHPLAPWVDYWELGSRIVESTQDDLEAFYARWPGSYVEDRMRNDWLLVLGQRRDWNGVAREFPRFRMNDDRQVTCYALLADFTAGKTVARDVARQAWLAQPVLDDGCQAMAGSLYAAGVLTRDDVWERIRQAAEDGRPNNANAAAALLGAPTATEVAQAFAQPARTLARRALVMSEERKEIGAVALARLAAGDAKAAAAQLADPWARLLLPRNAAWAWGQVARRLAGSHDPQAAQIYADAFALLPPKPQAQDWRWSDATLAWAVRAALRPADGPQWKTVLRAVDMMSEAELRDSAWPYWRARALRATAAPGARGDAQRQQAAAQLAELADPLHFYGQLALEEVGGRIAAPPQPAAPSAAERSAARAHPGLSRALQLIGLGLRSEGVREWNFSLRGMGDRELLAAAQLACEREVWDRCIHAGDRTKAEIDLALRYPTPLRSQVVEQSRQTGIDPAYVYGLIRQESRFIMDARSHVGASGLMQLMPATASATARKLGIAYSPALITDRELNLRLGTAYLKSALDEFDGAQALAAAAYNAGPGRPRRWREGQTIDAAAWVESIPFAETRDYVKKVLANANVYALRLASTPASIRTRLGAVVGPAPVQPPASSAPPAGAALGAGSSDRPGASASLIPPDAPPGAGPSSGPTTGSIAGPIAVPSSGGDAGRRTDTNPGRAPAIDDDGPPPP